jgi:hypothetical protein
MRNIWSTFFQCTLTLANIQGRVYEWLYSPKALQDDDLERTRKARQLAAELRELESRQVKVILEIQMTHSLP